MTPPRWGETKDEKGNLLPGGKNFFRNADRIARELGDELMKRGIHVTQSKEKFGEIRNYVYLRPKTQAQAYREAYQVIIKKYPEYRKFLSPDYPELLLEEQVIEFRRPKKRRNTHERQ